MNSPQARSEELEKEKRVVAAKFLARKFGLTETNSSNLKRWHPLASQKGNSSPPTPVFQKRELLVSGRVLEKILKNWTMLPLKAWEKGEIRWNGQRNLIQTIMKHLQLDIKKLNYFYLWLEQKIYIYLNFESYFS